MRVDVVAKKSSLIIIKDNVVLQKPKEIEVIEKDFILIKIKNLSKLVIRYHNISIPIKIIIDSNQVLDLTKIYEGENNFNSKIVIGENCQINYLVFNQAKVLNKNTTFKILKKSDLKVYFCNLENGLTKQKLHFDLDGWNARVKGIFGTITSKDDEMDYEIYCNHNFKDTFSKIENFGIAKDQSSFRFNIWGIIKEKMDEVETHQKQKILVFNPEVKLEANPYLIIKHNNVKATHGVAIGKINEQHLFYLKTRGISAKEAKKLIVWGYFLPLILKIENKQIQNIVKEKINERIKFNV